MERFRDTYVEIYKALEKFADRGEMSVFGEKKTDRNVRKIGN